MKHKTYVYHTDPGHGWLAVKRHELERLNIAREITQYSYASGDTVYLEEDLDMQNFFIAYNIHYGQDPKYRTSHRERTFVRNLAPYTV